MQQSRRQFLAAAAASSAAALSGCLGGPGTGGAVTTSGVETVDGPTPPAADNDLHIPYEFAELRSNVVSGGVPKDGIPSIDDPQFKDADDAEIPGGDPVFGVVRDGEAKAYPQDVLVHHEIVNDELAGDAVAVTYCPLTGTVQGFERGDVEFGVSGRLLNANLVMYDRSTDSRWPQMLATAIDGPLEGQTLREFRLVWTTWGSWRRAHPDTQLLTSGTDYLRDYDDDPYGSYNPQRGYYASDDYLFEPLAEDDRDTAKSVVLGARTGEEAVAFDKSVLLNERVLECEGTSTPFVAVADRSLATGFVYENPDERDVTSADDGYRVDGEVHEPDDLPLDRVLAWDAMWFAWAGYYPDTAYVG
jgi:hypothetical protein